MDSSDHQKIRQLFDDYLRMYSTRDDLLTTCFSEDFSGFTGGGNFLVKDRAEWVAITRQDFAQVKDPLRIELKDLMIQSLADTTAVATAFLTIHLPIEDHILSRETARLVLIFRQESADWKISHCSYSIPYSTTAEGEVYPLQELAVRNQSLETLIAERTIQLSEANDNLQQTNEELAREIADHKQADDALRESEVHYRLLTENVSDVVWQVDSDYLLTYISPADERLRGYRAEEMIGQHIFNLFDEDGIATLTKITRQRQEIEQHGMKSGTISYEAQQRCKDGEWLWVEVRSTPERDVQGTITGYYGITREITDRKRAEDELHQQAVMLEAEVAERQVTHEKMLVAKQDAEIANRVKSEFLANMSHEIRTPMNGIIGMTQLLYMTELTEEQREYLGLIDSSGHNLLALINNILDLSKIESGMIELENVEFSLERAINDVTNTQRAIIGSKKLTITILVAPDVPKIVLGDQLRFKQIILNLLGNAVKFTAQGSISISAMFESRLNDTVVIRISVSDTGIGMAAEQLEKIFGAFAQADASTTRKYGGTGLGLAISQNLAKLLRGKIWVESEPEVGSRFHLVIPFTTLPIVAGSSKKAEIALQPARQGRPLSVLVAEDNEINQKFITTILGKMGHKVICVPNGELALEQWRQREFDCILMDIQMPVLGGEAAVAVIRGEEAERGRRSTVIALTAHALIGDRERFLENGFDGYLTKPVLADELAEQLKLL